MKDKEFSYNCDTHKFYFKITFHFLLNLKVMFVVFFTLKQNITFLLVQELNCVKILASDVVINVLIIKKIELVLGSGKVTF